VAAAPAIDGFQAHFLLPFAFAFCLLPSAFCLLPSAFCLLPFAFCLLPSAFCLLPSAFCLPQGTPRPESTTDRPSGAHKDLGDFRPKSRIMGLMIRGVTAARLLK
jgi:hypothetical protein